MNQFDPLYETYNPSQFVQETEKEESAIHGLSGKVKQFVDKRPGACIAIALAGGVLLGCLFKQPTR